MTTVTRPARREAGLTPLTLEGELTMRVLATNRMSGIQRPTVLDASRISAIAGCNAVSVATIIHRLERGEEVTTSGFVYRIEKALVEAGRAALALAEGEKGNA
jgi:hypothetical protein